MKVWCGSGRRAKGGAATSPITVGSGRAVSSLILCPHEPDGPRDSSVADLGSRLLVRAGLPRHQLAQPFAVVTPGPAAGHPAPGHGADGATDPDRRIDVH